MSQKEIPMKENKMGVMSENKLLVTMSLPMVISMLVQALYNIVDSMFVAKLSENALTAVSLAFPVQNLMIAVGTGTGVGINALVSRALGEKKNEYANSAVNNGIYLAIFSFIGFAIVCGFFAPAFFSVQTDDPQILAYGVDYVRVIGIMSFGLFIQLCAEKLLQSTGKTIYSMATQLIGAVINIILDPIMIFGLFGFPRMEVTGAALATVTGQIIAAVIGVIMNIKLNKELHISLVKYKLNGEVIRHIYSVGFPSIIMASVGSVMTFGMNKILMGFTSTATAVFRRILQAAELYLYAGIWSEQWSGTYCRIQLRCEKAGSYYQGHKAEHHLRRVHYAGRICSIPAFPGSASWNLQRIG